MTIIEALRTEARTNAVGFRVALLAESARRIAWDVLGERPYGDVERQEDADLLVEVGGDIEGLGSAPDGAGDGLQWT
jgi:hypothetical protein